MMTGGSINQAQIKTLDYLAAKTAHTIVETAKVSNAPKDIENLITKALGVLQAQGVYAMYLFLYSQAEGEKPATFVLFHLWNALKDPEVPVPLPGNVRVERLQDKKVLFCEPRKFQNIDNRSFNEQTRAEREMANQCVQLVNQHSALWGLSHDNALNELRYTLQQRGNNWEVKAGNPNLHSQFTQLPSAREIILTSICNLTADLDTLLLVRDLYERTLIYARYHAKALG